MSDRGYLKIGAFFDGRPGHEKQTKGIIKRLQERVDVTVISQTVTRKPAATQIIDLLRFWCYPGQSAGDDLADCDLLLGAGTPTHLPMLEIKKSHSVPVAVCMTPVSFLQPQFDLIFAPQHDNVAARPNIFPTVGPPNPNVDEKKHNDNCVLILCGGIDSKSHLWNSSDIAVQIEKLINHNPEKEIIISSSPRTPAESILQFISLADQFNNVRFHDYRNTPTGWVEEQYARCLEVWVTGDSISMVYEALSSGCRVGILPVQWRSEDSKFSRSERYLKNTQRIIDIDSYLQNKNIWKEASVLNEAERCAEEILQRFL